MGKTLRTFRLLQHSPKQLQTAFGNKFETTKEKSRNNIPKL